MHLVKKEDAMKKTLLLIFAAVLLASCSKMLESAEQKVVKLRKGADRQPEELPFEDEA